MTDRPYTDDDLRTEAARQITAHRANQDERQTLSAMLDAPVESTRSEDDVLTFDEALECSDLGTTADAIHALIKGAANVSEWAVKLGADGLEPDGHMIQLASQGPAVDDEDQPAVRMHFAFAPEMDAPARDRFVMELTKVVGRAL